MNVQPGRKPHDLRIGVINTPNACHFRGISGKFHSGPIEYPYVVYTGIINRLPCKTRRHNGIAVIRHVPYSAVPQLSSILIASQKYAGRNVLPPA